MEKVSVVMNISDKNDEICDNDSDGCDTKHGSGIIEDNLNFEIFQQCYTDGLVDPNMNMEL